MLHQHTVTVHCSLQSLVIVSKLPFTSLFSYINDVIAPEFFENGIPSLEAGLLSIELFRCNTVQCEMCIA